MDGWTAAVDPAVLSTHEYRYDDSGNLILDRNKGLGTITYNHLNKPTLVQKSTTEQIRYIYSADGTKLRQIVSDNGTITKTDYTNGFHYKTDLSGRSLGFITHEEGRFMPDGTSFNFEYTLSDHLGNSRVCFKEDPAHVGKPLLIQETQYYAFGMEISDLGSVSGSLNGFLYNGKELQDELNLGWYDYGARMYDPTIGRWNGVDALGIIYHENTPYNYALNCPIYFKDPDGNRIVAHDESDQTQILANITDQLGENNGFYFNKKGVLKYKKKELKKAQKGFNEEQNSMADGLVEVVQNEDRVIEIRMNEDTDEFTVDIYEPGFAKNEDGSLVMEDGAPKREGWEKTGFVADLNTKNAGGALFWVPGKIATTKTKAYAYIAINRKTVSTLQLKGEEGKLTTPSESSVFIHEVLDHGLDFIKNGNVDKSRGESVDNVKYHNQALKNISKGKSPLRTSHYHK